MPRLRVYTLTSVSTRGSAGSTFVDAFQAASMIRIYGATLRMERYEQLSNQQAKGRYQRGGRTVITCEFGAG